MATLRTVTVTTLDLPELVLYQTLRRLDEHERAGVLVATNVKVVKRLLASPFAVESALLTPAWLETLRPLLEARPEAELPVYLGDKALLEQITGYTLHQGALAVGRIPPQPGLDALLQRAPRPWLLTAVDGIASAENLGAIVRNAAAFGTDALVVGETCGSPFQRRAVSGSMGTIFSQPVAQVADLPSTLRDLQRRGVRCVAAHLGPGTLPLREVDLRGARTGPVDELDPEVAHLLHEAPCEILRPPSAAHALDGRVGDLVGEHLRGDRPRCPQSGSGSRETPAAPPAASRSPGHRGGAPLRRRGG